MKLPVIRQILRNSSGEEIENTISVLENISEASALKEEELEVIGELISNLCGASEALLLMKEGLSEREALNTFMKKVMGSIDR